MRDIRPLRTEADYDWALAEVAAYFDNQPSIDSEEGKRFAVIVDLIARYEDKHYPMTVPDPVSMLEYAIRDMGRSQTELATLLGSRSRASEILKRKRRLSLDQIRIIADAWRLPTDVLIRPYDLNPPTLVTEDVRLREMA